MKTVARGHEAEAVAEMTREFHKQLEDEPCSEPCLATHGGVLGWHFMPPFSWMNCGKCGAPFTPMNPTWAHDCAGKAGE